ncbi:MAG: hypothetical protein KatS3mg091_084 [Patescibacteria group bacterium]|nr:MAG: hypothetical protein KatS3mg091_084 [Patescibacteria group bacterium]
MERFSSCAILYNPKSGFGRAKEIAGNLAGNLAGVVLYDVTASDFDKSTAYQLGISDQLRISVGGDETHVRLMQGLNGSYILLPGGQQNVLPKVLGTSNVDTILRG